VLAIGIVGLLLHWVGPAEVRTRLAACPPSVALAALAAALLGQWLGALRFTQLAHVQGLALTRVEALGINLSTVFYSLFLPGGTATSWIVRLLRLPGAREQLGLALAIIAADRAFATAAGAILGLAADLALRAPATLIVTTGLAAAMVGAAFIGWALLLPDVPDWLERLRNLPFLRRLATRAIQTKCTHYPMTKAALGRASLLSIAVHGLGIFAWWILARAIDLDLGLLEIAWVRSASLVVGLLPITVGGLGLREGTTIVLLAFFNVAAADALALSLLAFLVTTLGVGAVGGVGEAAHLLRQRT
jgi:glycosyltransferase 2 family protein